MITLLKIIGKPSAPTSTGDDDAFLSSTRITSRPPSTIHERVTRQRQGCRAARASSRPQPERLPTPQRRHRGAGRGRRDVLPGSASGSHAQVQIAEMHVAGARPSGQLVGGSEVEVRRRFGLQPCDGLRAARQAHAELGGLEIDGVLAGGTRPVHPGTSGTPPAPAVHVNHRRPRRCRCSHRYRQPPALRSPRSPHCFLRRRRRRCPTAPG